MSTLPSLPSALIRLALSDLSQCEKDPHYTINMNVWHDPEHEDGICHVCLAGAVMAKTLAYPHDRTVLPSITLHYPELSALDHFRTGDISSALRCLHIPLPPGIPMWTHTPIYDEDPAAFHTAMSDLATLLESHSL